MVPSFHKSTTEMNYILNSIASTWRLQTINFPSLFVPKKPNFEKNLTNHYPEGFKGQLVDSSLWNCLSVQLTKRDVLEDRFILWMQTSGESSHCSHICILETRLFKSIFLIYRNWTSIFIKNRSKLIIPKNLKKYYFSNIWKLLAAWKDNCSHMYQEQVT